MANLKRMHMALIHHSVSLAENVVKKETRMDVGQCYDLCTLQDGWQVDINAPIYAQVFRLEKDKHISHYRICLHDEKILEFLATHQDVDMLSFLVYLMTHELIHIQRFIRGQADFDQVSHDEEILVDGITRLFLAKHPVTGRKRILNLLDKLTPPPLYNFRTIIDHGGTINAYL